MAISITEALDIINDRIEPLSTEIIPIEESLGRIVSREYIAVFDLPRFDNSAMDGYAVKIGDKGREVKSNSSIYAGDKAGCILYEGEAIRIMTGAPVPEGCEAIVPIEDVALSGDTITLPESIRDGAHIRLRGEDIKKGEQYIQKGDRVTAYTLALFASQGVTHISVVRKIRVAVFGTGDQYGR